MRVFTHQCPLQNIARLGAHVYGIDAASESVLAAAQHACGDDAIAGRWAYCATSAEALLASGAQYDAVVASEVIEHVQEPAAFVSVLTRLTRPGGALVLSTINRTAESLLLAKVAAEYVLRMVPVGTHDWQKFITPGSALIRWLVDGTACCPPYSCAHRGAGVDVSGIAGRGVDSDATGNGRNGIQPCDTQVVAGNNYIRKLYCCIQEGLTRSVWVGGVACALLFEYVCVESFSVCLFICFVNKRGTSIVASVVIRRFRNLMLQCMCSTYHAEPHAIVQHTFWRTTYV